MKKTAALALLLALPAAATAAAPYGAGFYDTSEYLAGRVAVNIIFVQSDGSIDTRTETFGWTAAKRSAVLSQVQSAMDWWAARNSAAGLSFSYTNTTLTTGYEPINRPSTDEALWIAQVMGKLGYTESDAYDRVFHYNADRRDALGTDWSYTIFMVDSERDSDGEFADNYFAYAYLGGPFVIMTYNNDGYGIANMAPVAAHEMGHIFYALDEYATAPCSKTDTSGYLNGPNTNCEVGGGGQACIMRGDTPPYNSPAVCPHTWKMLGWTDVDGNGKMDILDLPPTTALRPYSPDPTTNLTVSFTGAARSTAAYTNANIYAAWGAPRTGNNISINRVTGVDYKVDGGPWLPAAASDGTFDSNAENFTFTVSTGSGVHTFWARARDLYSFAGADPAPASDTLTINTANPTDIAYVQDGPGDDVDYSSAKSRVTANWGLSTHATGINRYEYAVGTSAGAADTVGWTSAGLSTWAVHAAALAEGGTYYFSVKAYSNSGLASGATSSDGFVVDTTSPTARVIVASPLPARTGAFSAKLIVTEAGPMGATPQLSFVTSDGLVVPLTVGYLTGSTWTAGGSVESFHSTGTASFLFSGVDMAGNRGTAITSGGTFLIDYEMTGGSSGTVSNSDGFAAYLPQGSYAGSIFVSISTVAAAVLDAADPGESKKVSNIDLARSFTARDAAGNPVTAFSPAVTLTLAYPDADNDGRVDSDLTRENTLWVYYLDPGLNKWTPLPGVVRDAAANRLTVPVDHFSVYAVRSANSSAAGMGALKAWPNPCDLRVTPALTIEGLPVDSVGTRVYIYNTAGELVRTLSPGDGVNGLNVISWDGTQAKGAKAATGLYLYLVKTKNYGKATGKVFIIW